MEPKPKPKPKPKLEAEEVKHKAVATEWQRNQDKKRIKRTAYKNIYIQEKSWKFKKNK